MRKHTFRQMISALVAAGLLTAMNTCHRHGCALPIALRAKSGGRLPLYCAKHRRKSYYVPVATIENAPTTGRTKRDFSKAPLVQWLATRDNDGFQGNRSVHYKKGSLAPRWKKWLEETRNELRM